ncbi:MAG TPA: phospholipase D-like domain-containing protein, partial [Stellaceae bacterium]|nr:phospholipase D-like domain-containing protein [Stellaceae bacterium]
MPSPTPSTIDRIIRDNLARLRKAGVLTVRPGYEIAGHQLTGEPAVVATVHTKKAKSELPRGDVLPDRLANVPVDVREATAYQRLRARDPTAAALAMAHARPEEREPVWPYEREMPGGDLLGQAPARAGAPQPAAEHALSAHATKRQIPYEPAPGASLDPVTTTTTITAHVSPDAGLATLQGFLSGTQSSLVVGMYDFTSGRILDTFETVLDGAKTLQMVLDNPAPNKTRDQTDTQTVEQLDGSLGARAKIVRALDRSDALVSAWIFPYAYHIKVIVRDGIAFWLSSGNLNNSNQPDLAAPPNTEDRDWHVIIEDAGLAKTFAAFLNQDFLSARDYQGAAAADAAAVADARAKIAEEENPPPPLPLTASTAALLPAQVFKDVSVRITPLLTPDKLPNGTGQYLTNIMALIASAQQRLYIQLQYIEASSETNPDYGALLGAIAGRVAAGVDVRLIESLQYGEKWAEKMKSSGVDLTANIALQPNVHNKGFVVDSKIVVVSSQNFSPAGVSQNRDAGVIIEHAGIAQYFEQVFLADWQNKARPFAPAAAA